MLSYKTLFITQRAEVHQRLAAAAAPAQLALTILKNPSREELLSQIQDTEFLISEREGIIDRELLQQARRLKLITRLGTRTWDIDSKTAAEQGIRICTVPIESCVQVAEHVIMQSLALVRRVRESMAVMQESDWNGAPQRCTEDHFTYNWTGRTGMTMLHGSCFGILGFGEIGAELAKRLNCFGCTVAYHKRARLSEAAEKAMGVTYLEREDLISRSDLLCSLLPYADDGSTVLEQDFFRSMKTGSYFMHCGGSGVVPEELIIEALSSGKLAGAALDPFPWEPMKPDHPILKESGNQRLNLILTPHVAAGGTSLTKANSRTIYYEDIVRFVKGESLLRELT